MSDEQDANTNLPKRDATELVEALNARAQWLSGQPWERTATQAMMQEASVMLAEQDAEIARLKAELAQANAMAEKFESAYEHISERGEECWNYCQQYAEGRLGRNIWHIVLEDAKKYRELRASLVSQVEALPPHHPFMRPFEGHRLVEMQICDGADWLSRSAVLQILKGEQGA